MTISDQYWYNSFPDGFYILIPPSLFFSDPFKVIGSNRCFYEVIYPRFSLPLAGLWWDFFWKFSHANSLFSMSLILTILLRPLLLLSLNKGDKLHDNLPYLYKPLSVSVLKKFAKNFSDFFFQIFSLFFFLRYFWNFFSNFFFKFFFNFFRNFSWNFFEKFFHNIFQQTLVAYPMYTMVLTIGSGAVYWGYAYLLLGFALFSISLYAAYASNQNYIRLITSSDRLIHIPCILW